jgi:hypothetical protein
MAEKRDRIILENVQQLDDVHTTRARWRHGVDLVSPVGAVHGLAHHRPVVFQILHRDQAAIGRHVGGNPLGNLAAIERIGSLLGDTGETPGQVALHESCAGGGCRAVGIEKDTRGCRVARQPLPACVQRARHVRIDGDAVARERDGRRHDLGKAHRAELLERHC